MRAYWTTNNATDTVVIPETKVFLYITKDELGDFLSEEPCFENWNGGDYDVFPEEMHELQIDEEAWVEEEFGTIVMIRDDETGESEIPDQELFSARHEFFFR